MDGISQRRGLIAVARAFRRLRAAVFFLALVGVAEGFSGCSGGEECSDTDAATCGVRKNQVTVLFRPGTTRARVEAINAEIGATIVQGAEETTIYRIKLPKGWCFQRGAPFYENKTEVLAVSIAIDVCPD